MHDIEILTMLPTARYLKHAGAMLDVKVSLSRKLGQPLVIHMRDFEFHSARAAFAYLRRIAETEMLVGDEARS